MEPNLLAKSGKVIKLVLFWLLIGILTLIGLVVVIALFANYRKNATVSSTSTGSNYGLAEQSAPASPPMAAGINKQGASSDLATDSSAGTVQQKVIKTASLDISVDEVDKTVSTITNETSALSGFIQNSSVNETTTGQKYGNLVLRVPANNFENLISKIKSLAQLVKRENINGKEVTQEYVDLQSSLTHNQAVEAQYLELLTRAQKVEEIVLVRDKLDQVQAQIEQIKGRLRYLDNQTEMSTISVNISSEVKVTLPAEKWRPWTVVKESASKLIVGLQNFVNFIIFFLFAILTLVPYLLFLILVYFFVRWLYRKFRKNSAKL